MFLREERTTHELSVHRHRMQACTHMTVKGLSKWRLVPRESAFSSGTRGRDFDSVCARCGARA